jgi:hypothetical protein
MTPLSEQQQSWLEDLVIKGQTTTKSKIANDLITIELASLIGSTQLAAENSMNTVSGSSVYILHTFAINLLSQALKSVEIKGNLTIFETPELASKYILSRPAVIIDAMINAQSAFEKELKQLVTPENLASNFTQTPGTEDGSSSISKE